MRVILFSSEAIFQLVLFTLRRMQQAKQTRRSRQHGSPVIKRVVSQDVLTDGPVTQKTHFETICNHVIICVGPPRPATVVVFALYSPALPGSPHAHVNLEEVFRAG